MLQCSTTDDGVETPRELGVSVSQKLDGGLSSGALFGRYRVLRAIGRGGMGAVYEAEHIDLEKRVALKTLHPRMAQEPEARARFLREGRVASKIRHPNVVEVFDVGQHDDGTLYLVMELLDGEALSSLMFREGTLSPERICDLLLPVIAAVATAHEVGVVHRDLKPENIFLSRSRNGAVHPKVLDFGISKIASTPSELRVTAERAMLGTPVYMSPEQARGETADARSDQYALGVILYEASTGKLPFEADELLPLVHAITTGKHLLPRALRPELSPDFEAVIERAISPSAPDRYDTVLDLGRALLPFANRTHRAVWRDVFGAHPTPLASSPIALPAASSSLAQPAPLTVSLSSLAGTTDNASTNDRSAPRPETLVPRVREVCASVSLAERAKVPAAILATLASILIIAAVFVPSPRTTEHSSHAPSTTPRETAALPPVPSIQAPAPSPPTLPLAPAAPERPPLTPPRETPSHSESHLERGSTIVASQHSVRPIQRDRATVRAATQHNPSGITDTPTDAPSSPSFRLCNGVPCP